MCVCLCACRAFRFLLIRWKKRTSRGSNNYSIHTYLLTHTHTLAESTSVVCLWKVCGELAKNVDKLITCRLCELRRCRQRCRCRCLCQRAKLRLKRTQRGKERALSESIYEWERAFSWAGVCEIYSYCINIYVCVYVLYMHMYLRLIRLSQRARGEGQCQLRWRRCVDVDVIAPHWLASCKSWPNYTYTE